MNEKMNPVHSNFCDWERETYGTCCHDLALQMEELSFFKRLWKAIQARWFFWRVQESYWLHDIYDHFPPELK